MTTIDTMDTFKNTGLNRALRDAQIIARARRGESLPSIAADFGISAEAVRRLLLRRGEGSVRAIRRDQNARTLAESEKLAAQVSDWVNTHPGCTLDEIRDQFMIDLETAREAARSVQHLILDGRRRARSAHHNYNTQWHPADACAALATAAEFCSPLTREKYDEMRLAGLFNGPSGAWITTRFPSWRDACAEAGIECGEPRRAEYTRRWNRADMAAWVSRYIREAGSTTSTGYEPWARKTEGAPSGPTIRNEFKAWAPVVQAALEALRATWYAEPTEVAFVTPNA